MTHSSYSYDLIKDIWYKDKELVDRVEIRDDETGLRTSDTKGFG